MKKYLVIILTLVLSGTINTAFSQSKSHKYVGVKKCKTCHKTKKIGNQYKIWLDGPHANALKSLSSEKAMQYAKENNIADPAKEPNCLRCHSTAHGTDASLHSKTLTVEEGVSCESCHGPGSAYKKKKIMQDLQKSIENGLIMPTEKTCIKCHNEKDNPFYKVFKFEERKAKIAHPVLGKK